VIRKLDKVECALVDQAILEYVCGAPLRLSLIAYGVMVWMRTRANNGLTHVTGEEFQFNHWVGPRLQLLKRAKRLVLVRGDGGGWMRAP
jgi:hypothetical protein